MPISSADAEHKAPGDSLRGFFCAASAYLIWGLSPIYWKTLSNVPPFEILLHRIVWSFFFLVPLVAREKNRREFFAAIRNRRVMGIMLGTAVLVSINWLVFIWAVANDRVLQTSLGYYINPLLSVLLALVILRERLRRAQALAVVLAAIGVVYLTVSLGQFPWVAFSLAITFGLYGLIRKIAPVSALAGLAIETLLLFPPAIAWLFHLHTQGQGAFLRMGVFIDLSLMATALVTALPLLLFTLGARRLHLSTIGFMQYITPSCFFLFAVFLFREPVSPAQITTFIFIWSALALYSADSVLTHRKSMHSTP